MWKKIIPLFVILFWCPFLVLACLDCHGNDEAKVAEIIERGMRSLSNVVVKYHAEFDTRVPFAELQKAIDAIDQSMLEFNYEGKAKCKLDPLRTLNSDARLEYESCVRPVYEWCVSVDEPFYLVISLIAEAKSKEDRDMLWSMVTTVLTEGQNKVAKSLEIFKNVQKKMSDLKNLLDSMLHDVKDDFNPNGYYGKLKEELKTNITKSDENNVQQRKQLVIHNIFCVIVVFIVSPLGISLGLLVSFTSVGLEEVVTKRKSATYEDQLRTLEEFFKILNAKIRDASHTASLVVDALKEDNDNLSKLEGIIKGTQFSSPVLKMSSLLSQSKFVPNIEKLKKTCVDYTKWHTESSKYRLPQLNRYRREISTYQPKRWKAMPMVAKYLALHSPHVSQIQ